MSAALRNMRQIFYKQTRRSLFESSTQQLVVRLTVSQAVPRYIMLLEERPNVFLLIHEIFNVEFVTTDSNIS